MEFDSGDSPTCYYGSPKKYNGWTEMYVDSEFQLHYTKKYQQC